MVTASESKERLNYIHPLALCVVNFGGDIFLVNVKLAEKENMPNGDGSPDPAIKLLDEWSQRAETRSDDMGGLERNMVASPLR
ncbi:hypothetical protein KSF_089070 [Reticulibacter mediterranei]|uniref:Uncharacterized protein n=1 Tax=Reticulibacter mediterranei TaxID=2778369 RepID=A0A8J3N598_9CHLR|nr:hypothetical protein [Reticulibacter mediterranei]GHO98859.1 hypothetical protein KSF_089070 [Reticulibacter mediterranei]